jgi:hypothetical protein
MNHYISTYHSDNLPIAIDTHHQTVVSGITTGTSTVNDVVLRSMIATASRTESSSMTSTEPSCSTTPTTPSQGTSRRGGHQKGTTNASKEALNSITREALYECITEFVTLNTFATTKSLKDVPGRRCRVPRGEFQRVVKRVCSKYNLEASGINVKKILSRTKPGHKLRE